MKKKVGILRFLGTNCDRDVWQAVEAAGGEPQWLWHADHFHPDGFAGFVVPGGFSYGDYLRCGALAAKAPVMKSLSEANTRGLPILGICNGFQILCEAKLLPGALVRNVGRKFIDRWETLRGQGQNRWWSSGTESIRLPIAHGEGRYFVEPDQLKKLQDKDQIWFTYAQNPNGSVQDIAGVTNELKNVCGLMPHPERAMTDWMGGVDGRRIMESVLS
ncbi:MAG: phosphoribosylformylglycinamidine synthase subunit PurQ [Bdellovibrionales bacterium]